MICKAQKQKERIINVICVSSMGLIVFYLFALSACVHTSWIRSMLCTRISARLVFSLCAPLSRIQVQSSWDETKLLTSRKYMQQKKEQGKLFSNEFKPVYRFSYALIFESKHFGVIAVMIFDLYFFHSSVSPFRRWYQLISCESFCSSHRGYAL